jgi:hypothetical protein
MGGRVGGDIGGCLTDLAALDVANGKVRAPTLIFGPDGPGAQEVVPRAFATLAGSLPELRPA